MAQLSSPWGEAGWDPLSQISGVRVGAGPAGRHRCELMRQIWAITPRTSDQGPVTKDQRPRTNAGSGCGGEAPVGAATGLAQVGSGVGNPALMQGGRPPTTLGSDLAWELAWQGLVQMVQKGGGQGAGGGTFGADCFRCS